MFLQLHHVVRRLSRFTRNPMSSLSQSIGSERGNVRATAARNDNRFPNLRYLRRARVCEGTKPLRCGALTQLNNAEEGIKQLTKLNNAEEGIKRLTKLNNAE